MLTRTLGKSSMKIESKCNNFHSIKWFWQCCLQKGIHFVWVSIFKCTIKSCYNMVHYDTLVSEPQYVKCTVSSCYNMLHYDTLLSEPQYVKSMPHNQCQSTQLWGLQHLWLTNEISLPAHHRVPYWPAPGQRGAVGFCLSEPSRTHSQTSRIWHWSW